MIPSYIFYKHVMYLVQAIIVWNLTLANLAMKYPPFLGYNETHGTFPLLLSGIQLPKSLAAKYLENPNQNRQKVEHLQLFTTISPSFWVSIDHFYHQSFIFEKHPELHPTRWAPDPVINGDITPRVITPVLSGQLIPNPQPELFGHFGWSPLLFTTFWGELG